MARGAPTVSCLASEARRKHGAVPIFCVGETDPLFEKILSPTNGLSSQFFVEGIVTEGGKRFIPLVRLKDYSSIIGRKHRDLFRNLERKLHYQLLFTLKKGSVFLIGNENVLEKVYNYTRAKEVVPVAKKVLFAGRQRYSFVSVLGKEFISNLHSWLVAPFLAATLISVGKTEPFLSEIAKNALFFFKYGILLVGGKIWVHKLLLPLADIVKPLDIFSHRKQDVSVLKSVRLSNGSIASLTPLWRYYFSGDLEAVLSYFSIDPLVSLLSSGYNFVDHVASALSDGNKRVIENADHTYENH